MADRAYELSTDILVAGASVGGVAAAFAALRLGRDVILTDPTAWPGGQLTAQLVPPDEHPWIEQTGSSTSWRELRRRVREYYRAHYPLRAGPRADALLNPGKGAVGRLCAEPRVMVSAIFELFAPYLANGQLSLLLEHVPVDVQTNRDLIAAVTFEDNRLGDQLTISAALVIDATEFGDIIELAGVESVIGAESQTETGELHALPGTAQPFSQQAVTWCAAIDYLPGENHTIDKPADYERWRDHQPTPWGSNLFGWNFYHPVHQRKEYMPLFAGSTAAPRAADWWHYRRLLYREHFEPGFLASDVTVINWPQNDYWARPLVGVSREERQQALDEAKAVTRALLYWLQTDAPREDGGIGYPGLRLRPGISGTLDGFAKHVYVRESRRIRALATLTEAHVGVEQRGRIGRAERFEDSVGVGYYRIDLHSTPLELLYIDVPCYPFQFPLGCLIPQRVDNLLPGAKNAGVTHVTNGATRMHPSEWMIGEAAGALAAFVLQKQTVPRAVHASPTMRADFQALLTHRLGVDLAWPEFGTHDELLIDW